MSSIIRSTMKDTLAIVDPLYSDNFELYFPTIPQGIGGARLSGASDGGLRLQCKSATIPGIMNEAQDITLHGFKLSTAGRTTFSNTLSVTYMENRSLTVQRVLKNWVNSVRDFRTQTSIGKAKYAVQDAQLLCYNETGGISATFTLWNCFCSEVQDISMDGTSANIIDVNATFRYDFADERASTDGASYNSNTNPVASGSN